MISQKIKGCYDNSGESVGVSNENGGLAGRRFGPYTVLERIGVGGMATVHLATEDRNNGSERVVALKRLLPHLATDEEFIRSFVREAQLSSLLHHDNIAEVYELGRVGECYFIAMEYIHGCDLRSCLKQAQKAAGAPPLDFTIFLMMELCEALAYAHTRVDKKGNLLGLVHRDISPSNLLISADGHLKIIDFGIAKATEAHEATRSGAIKGKLSYLPPETLTGNLDARADLFSVGVVAHELLTARPLFADKNDFRVLHNIQHLEPPPPSSLNPLCPTELDAVVLRALAKDPDQRWQSAELLHQALKNVADQCKMNLSTRNVTFWIDAAFDLSSSQESLLDVDAQGSGRQHLGAEDIFSTIAGDSETHESLLISQDDIIITDLDDERPTEVEFSLPLDDIDFDEEPDTQMPTRNSRRASTDGPSTQPTRSTNTSSKLVKSADSPVSKFPGPISEQMLGTIMESLANSPSLPATPTPSVVFTEPKLKKRSQSSAVTDPAATTSPLPVLNEKRKQTLTVLSVLLAGVTVFFILLSLFG